MFAALGALRVGGFPTRPSYGGLTRGFNKYSGCCYCNNYKNDLNSISIDRDAHRARRVETKEMQMTDGFTPRPPRLPRGRPFEKGRSGNPGGRRVGCRNKTTIAAAAFLAGEAEALTRRAVERWRSSATRPRCGSASNASCRRAAIAS